MKLQKYEDIPASKLSGGNKKKLSVAISILGNPPIILLDEPSTGMDPQAKRFIWTVINTITTQRKRSAVILSTNSMEEAEALCSKIGIMVNGRFATMGSVQQIKSKYGRGYEIEFKISIFTDTEIKDFLISKSNILENGIDLNSPIKMNLAPVYLFAIMFGKYIKDQFGSAAP